MRRRGGGSVPDVTIDFLGDGALCVRALDHAPLAANARVHRIAEALRRRRVPGIRDVVPGMRDLVVHVDNRRAGWADVEAAVRAAAMTSSAPTTPDVDSTGTEAAVVEIPIVYGGEAGQDLAHVSSVCGLDAEEVCRRHAAVEYVVCFTGFLPGFPYLGLIDPALRLPRRATPRPRVPAGAVAIAGDYSGIYPTSSPGGWHLIGKTDATLFELDADPPARLAPGRRVRFVPVQRLGMAHS